MTVICPRDVRRDRPSGRPRLLGPEPDPQPATSSTEADVGASATSTSAARPFGRRYPTVRCTRLRGSARRPGVDAVAIATPVSTHHPLGARSARGGQARVHREAARRRRSRRPELIAVAARARADADAGPHVPLQPAGEHDPRPHPSGELGDIYFISTSRVNLGLHQPDVSVAWDLGPHDFSILRYWLEETPSHVPR